MTINEIRARYLAYFEMQQHKVIPSAPLVPENDPTTLFTSSGMQPLLQYFLGEKHPQGTRIADSQKCFRADDIEETGDNRHTTFFEMLGNWSFGDYFKEEQLSWFFNFLVDEVKLDPKNIYVTVFSGDEENDLKKDIESVEIWKKLFSEKGIEATDIELLTEERGGELGMQGGRIFYYDAGKNWWSRSGVPSNMPVGEPGGPDSEVFYDFGTEHDKSFGENCHPNCDCGRFVEIGNSVFMQFIKNEDGTFGELPQKNVDFGGGLERIVAASNGNSDVFTIDLFEPLIKRIEELSGKSYSDEKYQKSFRIIADHLRGAMFMSSDGVIPSNTEAGYFMRRLIRRAVRHIDSLGVEEQTLHSLIDSLVVNYEQAYPALTEKAGNIKNHIADEENKFRKTLASGLKKFEKFAEGGSISGVDASVLFTTYGFPLEITMELAEEKGIAVDEEGFKEEMKKHQELSRSGADQKFKGGLADTSEMSVKYHTTTHLLHQALKDVFGPNVNQKGSNITPDRLRFDFSFDRKMTLEEKDEIEKIVNERIKEALPVTFEDLTLEEAKKRGAVGLFEEKYGDKVRVYAIGDYSLELCGGPHVLNTSELGHFKIKKEEASSAGVRRIKAILE